MHKYVLIAIFAACAHTALTDRVRADQPGDSAVRDTRLYHEPHRPQFHFSPPQQWMNDPNGLIFDRGEYHLFYQYHPYSNKWGPMHWGHAVSRDTVHWENLPIALFPDRNGAIFSGSAILDSANTSGFGSRAKPALVAMFTYHDHLSENLGSTGFEAQGLAYSLDAGRNWIKYPGNPVLTSPAVRDFRDPKVFWFAPTKRWIVALAMADHIAFYSSRDLKRWTHESDFGRDWGSHAGVWECPDLFAMPVQGSTKTNYVLLVSVGKGGPNGGTATQYFVGDFDGHGFSLDPTQHEKLRSAAQWIDYGTDNYAGSTWSTAKPNNGRPRFIGWMSNWQYATVVPTERWRSAMTLPRELSLVNTERGFEVHSLPAPEVQTLRTAQANFAAQRIAQPFELANAANNKSGLMELNLDLDTRAADTAELIFSNELGEMTVFRINKKEKRYELDRRSSGAVNFDPTFSGIQTAPMRDHGDRQILQVFVDQSSIEIFINRGELVLTALVFPAVPYNSIQLRSESEIGLTAGTVYALKSIWD